MRTSFLMIACLVLFWGCVPQKLQNNQVITIGDEETAALDASVPTAPVETQDSGNGILSGDNLDAGPQPGVALDAGDSSLPNVDTSDSGVVLNESTDAGRVADCATAFFDDLAPHLPDLVVVQGESDSYWYELNEASAQTGAISLDELRSVFAQVGSGTEGVIEEDWDDDLVWVIEYADDPQAAQDTLDAVEGIFSNHLTDITYVHFGASEDVEQYFLRVGRSVCGEILGLWTLVIWT
jgi:hypothetical protein